ncbi:ureidoglycolate hydrolase [Xylariomycetidae sp. FL2044]|nr:ureidoglycolate hydrolase [Xylariomycetidae sp. FL2044]
MLVKTLPITQPLSLTAEPLTREAFAPFGEVVANPRPECRPDNTTPEAIASGALPCGAVSANQGTAIQYRALASLRNLYDGGQAAAAEAVPSGKPASPRMTMFVCGARELEPVPASASGSEEAAADGGGGGGAFDVKILERHPFTTQTFIPLTADSTKRYLVIVAPSLAALTHHHEESSPPLPAPSRDPRRGRPGPGLPDVRGMRAFVARGDQAVTYGAGTWHAPMVALGPRGSTIDFVVVQFANDVPIEDCQEVGFESAEGSRVLAVVPGLAEKGTRARL